MYTRDQESGFSCYVDPETSETQPPKAIFTWNLLEQKCGVTMAFMQPCWPSIPALRQAGHTALENGGVGEAAEKRSWEHFSQKRVKHLTDPLCKQRRKRRWLERDDARMFYGNLWQAGGKVSTLLVFCFPYSPISQQWRFFFFNQWKALIWKKLQCLFNVKFISLILFYFHELSDVRLYISLLWCVYIC